jgi:hypothetical protein
MHPQATIPASSCVLVTFLLVNNAALSQHNLQMYSQLPIHIVVQIKTHWWFQLHIMIVIVNINMLSWSWLPASDHGFSFISWLSGLVSASVHGCQLHIIVWTSGHCFGFLSWLSALVSVLNHGFQLQIIVSALNHGFISSANYSDHAIFISIFIYSASFSSNFTFVFKFIWCSQMADGIRWHITIHMVSSISQQCCMWPFQMADSDSCSHSQGHCHIQIVIQLQLWVCAASVSVPVSDSYCLWCQCQPVSVSAYSAYQYSYQYEQHDSFQYTHGNPSVTTQPTKLWISHSL